MPLKFALIRRDVRLPVIGPGLFVSAVLLSLVATGCREPQSGNTSATKADARKSSEGSREVQQVLVNAVALNGTTLPAIKRQPTNDPLDPQLDGWTSEAFSELADQQLKKLADLLGRPAAFTPTSFAPLLADDFGCPELRGETKVRVFACDLFTVERDVFDTHRTAHRDKYLGASGLAQALAVMLEEYDLAAGPQLRVKFKLFRAHLDGEVATTRQFLSVFGPHRTGMAEIHATVDAGWHWASSEQPPLLKSLRIEQLETSAVRRPQTLFADRTAEVFAGVSAYGEQLVHGVDYWLERLEALLTGQYGHHGIAIGDANGDGLDDVYLCQPGGLPNLLLVQNPDGSLRDVSQAAGVDVLDLSRSALLVDLDNDGDQDLVLATSAQLAVFENQGGTSFQLQVRLTQARDTNSITAADFDLDGDLDLYACIYSGDGGVSRGSPTPVPIHDARNGGRNLLFRNDIVSRGGDDRDWKFTNATADSGLDEDNHRWSYAACWEDYDNDGDLDLYVANDFGRNNLYRNNGGVFQSAATAAGLDEAAFGMSVAWGDYDRDGLMDVYVGNMFSGAGNRITAQAQFQPGASEAVRDSFQYAARGNSLFQNRGDGTFVDVSVRAGVTMGRWAWGSVFADMNNDGWEDVLVGNGFVTRENTGDL